MVTALLILAAVLVVAVMMVMVVAWWNDRSVCGWFLFHMNMDTLGKLLGVILSAIVSANES